MLLVDELVSFPNPIRKELFQTVGHTTRVSQLPINRVFHGIGSDLNIIRSLRNLMDKEVFLVELEAFGGVADGGDSTYFEFRQTVVATKTTSYSLGFQLRKKIEWRAKESSEGI